MKKESVKKKNLAVLIALVLSLFLFFAGLFSGLTANSIAEENAKKEYSFLINYVDRLDSELGSIQVQQTFMESLEPSERCNFADNYFSKVGNELSFYYSIFPTRLEEFEKNQELTEEYLLLKDQYTKLSLRAWLVAKENRELCDSKIIPILYFYSSECDVCTRQGQILDLVKVELENEGYNALIFTLDKDFEEPALDLIKEYYEITKVPAIVIDNRVRQGRVYTTSEIVGGIR